MTRLFTIAFTLLLLSPTAFAQNLLRNGSFETRDAGQASLADGWSDAVSGTVSLELAGEHHEGALSLMIVGDGKEHAARQTLINPEPRAYTLSAMVKCEGVDLSQNGDYAFVYGHILYKGLAYSNATHFFIRIPPGTSDWQRLTVTTQTNNNAPIDKIYITVNGKLSAGRAYVDQVELFPNADLSPEARLKNKMTDLRDRLAKVGEIDATTSAAKSALDAGLQTLQNEKDLKSATALWTSAAARLSHDAWAKLYPEAMSDKPLEARMLYHGIGATKEICDHYLDVLSTTRCNGVFYSLGAWTGVVHHSDLLPVEPPYRDFDALAYSTKEARSRGMKVFGYIAAFYGTHESISDNTLYKAHPDWFAKGPDANMPVFPDPANPEVVDFVVKMYVELATKYDLDGIGLDYIRYPTPDSLNYDERNRQEILSRFGIDILAEPFWNDPVKAAKVRQYRAEKIGQVVGKVRAALAKAKPGIKLIACLASDPDESLDYGNNWSVSSVNLDFGSPMNYDDRSMDLTLLAKQKAVCDRNKVVYIPAIGGMPDVHQAWSISTWAERIAIQRKMNADGIIVYRIGDLDPAVAAFLGNGPFYNMARFPEPKK